MNILQAIGICHLLHKHDERIEPSYASAFALASNQVEDCNNQDDVTNAILLGIESYQNGEVPEEEMEYALQSIRMLETQMVRFAKRRIAESN